MEVPLKLKQMRFYVRAAFSQQPIWRQRRTRQTWTILMVALLVLAFSSVLQLLRPVAAQAQDLFNSMNEAAEVSDCETKRAAFEASLPVPVPISPYRYVVQLVNESDTTLLAAANAAHNGPNPVSVLPREKTWVLPPRGVLTIDIPQAWENTKCHQRNKNCGAGGPLFWARTGCRYDIATDRAKCDTGECGGKYDCSKGNKSPLGPKALAEWTFNDLANRNLSAPDISVVDGVNLNMDIEPLGKRTEHVPSDPFWLDHPLTNCGEDLRTPVNCPIQ